MSICGSMKIEGESVTFGYFSFSDWLASVILSFPAPWSVGSLDGKYYGTSIFDSTGQSILSIWESWGTPSARERGEMSDEDWKEYCCDSHWESEVAFQIAYLVVTSRNEIAKADSWNQERPLKLLLKLVVEHCDWDGEVWQKVRSGGSDKRMLPGDPEVDNQLVAMGMRVSKNVR